MKILVITNLYPSSAQPGRSAFNQQQIERMAKRSDLRVMAPLPWAPKGLGKPPVFASAPAEEMINGVQVYHPRYLVTPKIGRSFYGWFFYRAIKPLVAKIQEEFDFDVIFSTWAYPDCYAASIIAKELNKPIVCKVHGSDINIIAEYPLRRRMIQFAFEQASSIVCVTEALKRKIRCMGIGPEKLSIIPNGVDHKKFKVMEKIPTRTKLGLPEGKKYILFIGNLTPVKGVKHLIEAMQLLDPSIELIILGDGELKVSLEKSAADAGLKERVQFLGRKPHDEIVDWMNAADVLCLPSLHEGCPNVVLEAFACGLPVVASETGGVPDLITSGYLGLMTPVGDSEALAKRLKQALEKPWNRSKIAAHAQTFDWDAGVDKIMNLLQKAIDQHHGR